MPRRFRPAALAVAATSTAYQRLAEARDVGRYPPPGRLHDVGGRRLHLMDHGGRGPTIVIETGAGSLALGWDEIIPTLTPFCRVVTYDRPGYGWSDPAGWFHTGDEVAQDLHRLLGRAGIDPPWILVGHSLGGIYARCFAMRYPDETAGLVLVDATHEDVIRRVGVKVQLAQVAAGLTMAAFPRGLVRAAFDAGAFRGAAAKVVGGSSESEVGLRVALYLRSGFRQGSLAEMLGLPTTLTRLRERRTPIKIPVAVVTAAAPSSGDRSLLAGIRPTWVELQEDLATLSEDSLHLTASRGGHFVHADDPDTVVEAVRHVVGRVRVLP